MQLIIAWIFLVSWLLSATSRLFGDLPRHSAGKLPNRRFVKSSSFLSSPFSTAESFHCIRSQLVLVNLVVTPHIWSPQTWSQMGDDSQPPGSPTEYQAPNQGIQHGDESTASPSNDVHGRALADSQLSFTQHPQQPYVPLDHAFRNQLNPAQTAGQGHVGSFNMSSLSGSLPHGGYRHPGYPAGNPQRFNPPVSSPSMIPQMPPQMAQFPGQGVSMGNQHYYVQHHHHIPQYYPGQLSPSQQQAAMPHRYYPVMNQQQAQLPQGYYYPQPGHFPDQSQQMSNSQLAVQYHQTTPAHGDYQGPGQPVAPEPAVVPTFSRPQRSVDGKVLASYFSV